MYTSPVSSPRAASPAAVATGLPASVPAWNTGPSGDSVAITSRRLAALLRDACASAGFPARFPVVGTLVGIVCGDVPAPVDFAGAKRTDEAAYAAFFRAMLGEGVAMAPGAYEAIFVGLGHTDAVLEDVGAAAERAARTAADTLTTLAP